MVQFGRSLSDTTQLATLRLKFAMVELRGEDCDLSLWHTVQDKMECEAACELGLMRIQLGRLHTLQQRVLHQSSYCG